MMFRTAVAGAAMTIALSMGSAASGQASAPCAAKCDRLVYFGSHGNAVYAARLDEKTGRLAPLGEAASVERPTWLVASDRRPILYAVSETGNDGKTQAKVYALAVDRTTGALTTLNAVQSGGGGATHLALDPRSQTVFVANFGTGEVAALPILADGRLGPPASVQKDYGSGPHPRQKSPHAHGVTVTPDGRHLLAPDLGADRTFVYRFDPASRALSPGDPPFAAARPGSGPRHAVFGRSGRFAYVNSELSGEITVYRWDGAKGRLDPVQTIATNAPGYAGEKSSAEMEVSGDGRFLYASNRGEDTLVVYAIDRAAGTLAEVQRVPGGGGVPWSFTLDPEGRWLLVANEATSSIGVFAVDRTTGKLTATGQRLDVPKPVRVVFPRSR